jgi:Fe-S cluster assembly protein SufB
LWVREKGLKDYPEIFRPWFQQSHSGWRQQIQRAEFSCVQRRLLHLCPAGVKVKHPLQAYFRINAENFGQFERTLIIADEGSEVTYMEGCTAPKFNTPTLHSAVVELVALRARRFSTSPCRIGLRTFSTSSPNAASLRKTRSEMD